MKSSKMILLAGAFALLPLHASIAAEPAAAAKAAPAKAERPANPGRWFGKADSDKNNMVSKKEFLAMHEQFFTEVDTNKDGNISQDEAKAQAEKRRAERKANREKKKQHGKH